VQWTETFEADEPETEQSAYDDDDSNGSAERALLINCEKVSAPEYLYVCQRDHPARYSDYSYVEHSHTGTGFIHHCQEVLSLVSLGSDGLLEV
jgi:hypothetical protein